MAITLPTIQRRQVQDLAKQDPYGPVRVANARANALSQWGKVGEEAAGLYKSYKDREEKESLRNAVLAVHNADSEFRRTYGGKPEYNPMEVNDENFLSVSERMEREDPLSPVPAHQVYAEWRAKNYEDVVKQAAAGIRDPKKREQFVAEQEWQRQSFYADDSIEATKDQTKYITKKTITRMEEAILKKDFGAARLEVALSEMPSDAKDRALFDIDKREQSDYFYETLKQRELPVMQKALEQLIHREPRFTSNLKEKEQEQLAGELRTAIGQEQNALSSAVDSSYKLQAAALRRQITDTEDGKPVNVESMRKNMEDLVGRSPVLVQEAEWAVNNQPIVSAFLQQDRDKWSGIYEHEKGRMGDDLEQSYLAEQMGRAMDAANRALATDAWKWATDTKLVEAGPMDLSSPGATAASLLERLPGVISIQSKHKAFTGFGSNAETAAFWNHAENLSIPEQAKLFGSISASLGEYAPPFYEQGKKHGFAGTLPLAGQLYAMGPQFHQVVEDMLKGAEIRKTNPVIRQEIKEAKLDTEMAERFGLMFAGNPGHQALMGEAFKDVWAITKDAEKAFRSLVGPTIDLGDGTVIQAPPGISSARQYRKRLNDMPVDYWKGENMQVYGYSPTELRDYILDGTFKQVGAEMGGVKLLNPASRFVTKPDGQTPFIFRLDPVSPTRSEIMEELEAKRKTELDQKKAREKAAEAEAFMKANPNVTKEDYEFLQGEPSEGMQMLKRLMRGGA